MVHSWRDERVAEITEATFFREDFNTGRSITVTQMSMLLYALGLGMRQPAWAQFKVQKMLILHGQVPPRSK